jgi:ribosomal protein L30E
MTETINSLPQEFEKNLGTKKVTFGSKTVIKALKMGKALQVIYASNAPEKLIKDIEYYAGLAGANVYMFKGTSSELGVKCKRAHSVLAAALLKGN